MYRRICRALPLGLTALLPLSLSHAAMYTPGQLTVSASGAATYTIPLQLPPATAGLAPTLALAYNSQTGNGIAGMGWSLGGQSTITRCPQTVAQDGQKGSVNYDANDRYCLDGERLVAVSGAYGANGTEYRTEKESFAKVVSYGVAGNGPAWFKVWTKSGLVSEYGNTFDSRVIATGKDTAAVWAQNRTQDVKGNYLTISYTRDIDYGDIYTSHIDYTATSAAGVATNGGVQFQYVARPDSVPLFTAGSRFQSRVLLDKVQTYLNGSKIKEYRLGYDVSPATKRSRLTSLAECDGAGVCLPSTVFTWSGDSNGAVTYASGGIASGMRDDQGWSSGTRLFAADLFGEGKVAMYGRAPDGKVAGLNMGLSDAAGYNDPLKFFVADVNGNGRVSLVTRTADGTFHTYSYDRTAYMFKPGADSPLGLADSGGWGSGTRYFLMDVNGDGRTDLVARYASGNLMTYLFDGSKFVQAGLTTLDQADSGGWGSGLRYFVMDVNGDGKMDLVARNANGDFLTFLSNGVTFELAGISPLALSDAGGWNSGVRYFTMDVNGDGKTDLVARDANGNFTTYLSNGTTFVSAGVSWFPGHTDAGGWNSGQRYFIMDANGDGMADIVARYGNGDVEVFASNGTGFSSIGVGAVNWSDGDHWNDGARFLVGDTTGNGRDGLIGRNYEGSIFVLKLRGDGTDLMVRVLNGLGAGTDITYNSLSSHDAYPDLYTRDKDAVYPIRDVQTGMYVVAAVANANGAGDQVVTNYSYGGLKFDQSGRDSLGFRWIKVVQKESGVTTLTENRQDWPFAGLPAKVTVSLAGSGNGGTLRQIVNTYGCIGYDGGSSSLDCTVKAGRRYFPAVSVSSDASWDLNGKALPSSTKGWQYDAYGNVIQTTWSSSDGYSERTDNTYSNDTANWFIGRLTRTTFGKQTP